MAYLLDSFVIYLVAMALSVSPLNPNYEEQLILRDEYEKVSSEYLDAIEDDPEQGELDTLNSEYTEYAVNTIYRQSKLSIYDNSIMLVLMIIYYVVFAYIFEGETVGKRVFHIKIESKDGNKVKIWQLFIRTLVLFGMPFTILNMVLPFIVDANQYAVFSLISNMLSGILSLSIIITFFIRADKRSIHDIIGKTVVTERN